LRGRANILKRLVVHGAAFNLSLILRKTLGVGKPRRLQGATFIPCHFLKISYYRHALLGFYRRKRVHWDKPPNKD